MSGRGMGFDNLQTELGGSSADTQNRQLIDT
jgi:hypothetical protein